MGLLKSIFSIFLFIFCFSYSLNAETSHKKIYIQPETIHFSEKTMSINIENNCFLIKAIHSDAKGVFVYDKNLTRIMEKSSRWHRAKPEEWKVCTNCRRENHITRTYCYFCGNNRFFDW